VEKGRGDSLPRARKRFGQHFLKDSRVLDAIADALGPIADRTVVEIGPGRGALTDRLVERAGTVIAIEIDRDLAQHLRLRYAGRSNVTIIDGDVLQVSLGELAGGPYVLAANVPYYITTPIIFQALEPPRPDIAVYLVQREVADRIAATAGDRQYGALSVNVQAFARVEFVRAVPAEAFSPVPKVESAVIRVVPLADPVIEQALEQRFRRFVQGAFGLRRKQLVRVVRTLASLDAQAASAIVSSCGLDPMSRPETLSPTQFAMLVRTLAP